MLLLKNAVIKVACIGNSITYGANIPNRNKNSYPAQLQAYLEVITRSGIMEFRVALFCQKGIILM